MVKITKKLMGEILNGANPGDIIDSKLTAFEYVQHDRYENDFYDRAVTWLVRRGWAKCDGRVVLTKKGYTER